MSNKAIAIGVGLLIFGFLLGRYIWPSQPNLAGLGPASPSSNVNNLVASESVATPYLQFFINGLGSNGSPATVVAAQTVLQTPFVTGTTPSTTLASFAPGTFATNEILNPVVCIPTSATTSEAVSISTTTTAFATSTARATGAMGPYNSEFTYNPTSNNDVVSTTTYINFAENGAGVAYLGTGYCTAVVTQF